ncbi:MAG: hypothetical protein V4677_14525 [Bacteroidota bacterium]
MTQTDKIRNIKDYLAQLRLRPGMYIGENKITKLHDHLLGYRMALIFNQCNDTIDKDFFDNFNDFVCSYYDVNTNSGWSHLILEQTFGNEEQALTTFFELYDLFVTKAEISSSKKIVMTLFDALVYNQKKLKEKLGDNFSIILEETFDLIKDNVITDSKCDFDYVLDQLTMKAENDPELQKLLTEIYNQDK